MLRTGSSLSDFASFLSPSFFFSNKHGTIHLTLYRLDEMQSQALFPCTSRFLTLFSYAYVTIEIRLDDTHLPMSTKKPFSSKFKHQRGESENERERHSKNVQVHMFHWSFVSVAGDRFDLLLAQTNRKLQPCPFDCCKRHG